MRSIEKVINAIRKEIPDNFEHKDTVWNALEDIIDSVHYTAPEAIGIRWTQVSELLEDFIGEPNEDWKKKIVDIFSGKIEVD